jgi:hypothetical protein
MMRRTYRKFLKNNKGVTALETAIVLPVFLLIIFGIMEFALIMHVSSLVENATHEAARLGSTGNSYDDLNPDKLDRSTFIQEYVRKRLGSWADETDNLSVVTKIAGSIVDFVPGGSGGKSGAKPADFGARGEAVLYTVTYDWKILTPIMAQVIGTGGIFKIHSSVVVQNENF